MKTPILVSLSVVLFGMGASASAYDYGSRQTINETAVSSGNISASPSLTTGVSFDEAGLKEVLPIVETDIVKYRMNGEVSELLADVVQSYAEQNHLSAEEVYQSLLK